MKTRYLWIALGLLLQANGSVAQESPTTTSWVTFTADCETRKHGGTESVAISKGEGGVCLLSPKSETYKNVGVVLLEKDQVAKTMALPGVSNLSFLTLPKPVVMNALRTVLVLN